MPNKNEDYVVPFSMACSDVPRLDDYFGIWSIFDAPFRSLVDNANGMNLEVHAAATRERAKKRTESPSSFEMTAEGVAFFWIQGAMMKSASSMGEGTSTVNLRQQIRAAKRDPKVRGAMMIIDSPGGTVKGNRDLADDVAAFAAAKPIYAFTEDLTASAAVSIASQATKRFANNDSALYGAMGTYSVLIDSSGQAEKVGVEVHVVRAGEFKGVGEPGTEITEKQLGEVQRIVDSLNDGYIGLIARGLGVDESKIRSIADGRIHTAKDALAFSLIDGVQSFETTYAALVSQIEDAASLSSTSGGITMSDKNTPATLAELKSKFPKSNADWREKQIEAEATIEDAAIAYAAHVEAEAKDREDKLQKELDEAKAKSGESLGNNALEENSSGGDFQSQSGDPVADFNSEVARICGTNATFDSRQSAIRQVANKNTDLYEAYLIATNKSSRKVTRQISDKMEEFRELAKTYDN